MIKLSESLRCHGVSSFHLFFLSLVESLGESGVFIGSFLVLLFYWRILFLPAGSVEKIAKYLKGNDPTKPMGK